MPGRPTSKQAILIEIEKLWPHIEGVWRWSSAALIVALCALAAMPLVPAMPSADIDGSWQMGMNAAVGQALQFGQDVLFTFGPYASLYTSSYYPATDRLALAGSLLIALALAAGLIALSPRGRWLALLLSLFMGLPPLRDPMFFLAPLLFVAVISRLVAARDGHKSGLLVAATLLLLALALLPLVKATFTSAASVGLCLGAGVLLANRAWRLSLAACVIYPLALALFWVSANQHLAGLPAYFAAQSLFVAGYTDAMSLPGPIWLVALYGGGVFTVLLLNLSVSRRSGTPGLAGLACAGALLLIAFKAGFVRQDEHVVIAGGTLALVAGVLRCGHPGKGPSLGLLAGLAVWVVLNLWTAGSFTGSSSLRFDRKVNQGAAGLLDRLRGSQMLQSQYDDALREIRANHILPPLSGTTDAYSTSQAIVLAYGLPWSPRPVLQSYAALSPDLAQKNAAHLAGDHAPTNVLVSLQSLDGRPPLLEDGPSWIQLLARYEVMSMHDGMAIMHLTSNPAPPVQVTPAAAPSYHLLNDIVPLPGAANAPLWAEIDVRKTRLGSLLSLFFKSPPLSIVMHMRDGRTLPFRYVVGMGKAGFIIAPLVGDATRLFALQLPDLSGREGARVFAEDDPAAFSIQGDARFWQAAFTSSLTQLHVQPQPLVSKVLFPVPLAAVSGTDHAARCWLDARNGQVLDPARPLTLAGLVRLTGWGFGGVQPGSEPDAALLTLTASDGAVIGVPASLENRPDVGAYFHQPHLSHIGFQALLDVRGLSGAFDIGLEMTKGNHHWTCKLLSQARIDKQPNSAP